MESLHGFFGDEALVETSTMRCNIRGGMLWYARGSEMCL